MNDSIICRLRRVQRCLRPRCGRRAARPPDKPLIPQREDNGHIGRMWSSPGLQRGDLLSDARQSALSAFLSARSSLNFIFSPIQSRAALRRRCEGFSAFHSSAGVGSSLSVSYEWSSWRTLLTLSATKTGAGRWATGGGGDWKWPRDCG